MVNAKMVNAPSRCQKQARFCQKNRESGRILSLKTSVNYVCRKSVNAGMGPESTQAPPPGTPGRQPNASARQSLYPGALQNLHSDINDVDRAIPSRSGGMQIIVLCLSFFVILLKGPVLHWIIWKGPPIQTLKNAGD